MNRTLIAAPGPDWLPCAVVYFNTADYPEQYVVREWLINPQTAGLHPAVWPAYVGSSLDEARAVIHREWPGLARHDRNASDDAWILETWL
jgi:hypothetical protein